MTLKDICKLFDDGYELEGRKKKENDLKVLSGLEKMYQADANGETTFTRSEVEWIIWMYGKTAKQVEKFEPNPEIMEAFAVVETVYDSIARQLSAEYRYTTMYDVVEHVE